MLLDSIFNNQIGTLSKDISMQLNTVLGMDLREVNTVKEWVDIFKRSPGISSSQLNIDFNAIFIHGFNHSENKSNPSGVTFDYLYGDSESRELADIIFILSVFEKKKKIFEKITLNQTKWGSINKHTSSWSIGKEQLYLLSRFPKFTGITGSFVPNISYTINDNSKCLGSYGLMTKENFLFLCAYDLQTIIGNKSTLNTNDLRSYNILSSRHMNSVIIPHRYYHNYSTLFCNNTYDFVQNYLQGRIGEILIVDYQEVANVSASNFFNDFLASLNKFGINFSNEEITNFINRYGSINSEIIEDVDYSFYKGLGIIQTKVSIDVEKR